MLQARKTKRGSCVLSLLICLMLLSISPNASAQTRDSGFQGYVRDESGAAVAGARVELRNKLRVVHTTTSEDGSFSFSKAMAGERLIIEAPGFAVFSQLLTDENIVPRIEVVLSPASIREQITVTATRSEAPLASTAASVRLLSAPDLSTTAALTLDDALRQVPGFQLFRRTGSRTANPTSQGVSLRGVGASGASRALILADGIPFADPFGGWVYWDRLPRAAISQVEVVRGGVSDLYGSSAMGGVVNILTRAVDAPTLSFESSYGNQETPNASLYAGTRPGKFTVSLAGEVFKTDGYVNVRTNDRGAVDTPVSSAHRSLYLELGYKPNENSRLFLKPSYFAESRTNGTPIQTNETRIAELDGGVDWSYRRIGEMSLRSYLSAQTYDQNFSAIAANRNSETLTRVQRVPAQATGLMFQWSRLIGNQNLVGGFEVREVRGASDETLYDRGKASTLIGAGGRQRSSALFFRDMLQLRPNVSISGGLRLDLFKNVDGLSVSRGLLPITPQTVNQFPDRSERSLSPHLSVVYNANEKLSLFASFNRAFREPTLNELYRSFRLGNVLTLANENLEREQSIGAEGGARLSLWQKRFDLRASFFSTYIRNPIANVTVSSSPTLITRQRQNLGRTRSRGFELDSFFRVNHAWNINVGYLFADARVASFPANVLLEGLMIPQTARHSLTFQVNYGGAKKYRFGLQGRISGSQFEDDQNLLNLPGFSTIDAYASRFLGRQLEVFVAAENLLNSRYEVGRTPVIIMGPPILFRLGIKINYRKEHYGD